MTLEEKKEVYNKAFTFRHDFADMVAREFKNSYCAVPPSGSDMFHPELWKGCHWKWFEEKIDTFLADKTVEAIKKTDPKKCTCGKSCMKGYTLCESCYNGHFDVLNEHD